MNTYVLTTGLTYYSIQQLKSSMSNKKSKNDRQYRCRKVPPSGYETVEVALTKAAAEATRDAWGEACEIAEAEVEAAMRSTMFATVGLSIATQKVRDAKEMAIKLTKLAVIEADSIEDAGGARDDAIATTKAAAKAKTDVSAKEMSLTVAEMRLSMTNKLEDILKEMVIITAQKHAKATAAVESDAIDKEAAKTKVTAVMAIFAAKVAADVVLNP